MAEINLNGLNSANSVSASQNTQPTSTTAQTSETISLKNKKTKEEWLAILIANGFTEAQVEAFLTKNPNFFDLQTDQQSEAVKTYVADKAKASVDTKNVDQVDSTETVNTVESPQTKKITVTGDITQTSEANASGIASKFEVENSEPKEFNSKEYNKMSLENKQKAINEEMLKNLFMYGDSNNLKTEEDWANLSQEAKVAFIEKIKTSEAYKNNNLQAMLDTLPEEGVESISDMVMTSIQASNRLGISVAEYNKLSKAEREEALYDYLYETKEIYGEDAFSETERTFWDRNSLLAESMNFYYKQQGEKVNVCPGDVSKHIAEINDNAKSPEDKIYIEKVQYEYLKNKNETGAKLSEYEKTQFANLKLKAKMKGLESTFQLGQDEKQLPRNSIYSKISESDKGVLFDQMAVSNHAKILESYIKKEFKPGSPEYARELMKCAMDASRDNKSELADELGRLAIASNSDAILRGLNKDTSATEVSVLLAGQAELTPEQAGLLAEGTERLRTPEMREAFGLAVQESSTEEQRVAIANVHIHSENKTVKNGVVINLRNPSKNIETLRNLDKIVVEHGDEEQLVLAAKTTGELHEDYQLESLKTYQSTGNKEVIKTTAGVISSLAEKNQVEAFSMTRAAASNLSDEDAKYVDMTLADQIPLCKNKDNQLAMHKEIMTSKFDEVQVRAAENIKNYDNSIKLDALAEVHKSGNIEALKKVAENIGSYPPDVQKSEIASAIGEVVLSSEIVAENLDVRVLSGTLTAREIAQLTPKQKQQYFIGLFEKATPAQKLQMMQNFVTSNMIGAMQKKVIYTMIARSPYLKDMVESGMGKPMLEAGLPLDAVNKIVNTMKISTSGTVVQQRKELAKDSSFSTYFEDDLVEKVKEQKPSHKYATGMKDTFTPLNIDAKTRAELARNKSTMFIKS